MVRRRLPAYSPGRASLAREPRATEPERAYDSLRATQAKLVEAEKLAAVGELAAGVANEINNPAAIIAGTAQHLLKRFRGRESGSLEAAEVSSVIEALQTIEYEIERCGRTTARLLLFAETKTPAMAALDIEEVTGEALALVADSLSQRNIRVKTELAPGLPRIRADAGQLKQVFRHVIVNAQQAMPGGGELTVETFHDAKQRAVGIRFTDTGVGIPEELRHRIFEPFFTTHRASGATGLGLSVSYGIIRAHQGTMEVASTEGGGTTMTINLPAQLGDEIDDAR